MSGRQLGRAGLDDPRLRRLLDRLAGVAAARADSAQNAITLTAVSSAVTDPADAPATVDALRDDLVANALNEIETALGNLATRDTELETAIETLAGEFNDLLAKLRTSGAIASA